MNIETALDFIQKHGNKIDRYRITYLLNERQNDEIPLKDLRNMQNTDGGFPYDLQKDKYSCVSQTCSMLSLIRELDLKKSDVCKKALQFLSKNQKQDGSWDENPRIAGYKPPQWDMSGKIATKTWLTAEIANNLIQLGYNDSEQVRKAAKFLKKNRDEKGKVVGYRIATWIAIPVFAQLKGIENETVQKSLKLV